MDIRMPGIDGIETTERIRKLPGMQEKPYIIALTANVLTEHRQLAETTGMQDFLSKPLRPADLRRALERAGKTLASP